MANSTVLAKPAKPRPDFPLFAHASGRWCKKVRGKLHYFGKWTDDPKGAAALLLWLDQKDDLLAGRKPRSKAGLLTIKGLCDRFCTVKEQLADAGDITRRTFEDYHATCTTIVKAFGLRRVVDDLRADDFEELRAKLAKRLNPNSLGNEVQRIRTVFKYGFDAGLIEKPVRFGPTFKRPAKRILRAIRQKKGPRMIEAAELRTIIDTAEHPLKAMILLAINTGFGNCDCGKLPFSSLDLKRGWVSFPRPKTAIERRCPLWPETIQALQEAIAERPTPRDPEHGELVFITKYRKPWFKDSKASPISAEFRKLLHRIDEAGRKDAIKQGAKIPTPIYREGIGFYVLRHIFETIGGETADQVAVDFLMGHADGSMAGVYRERISDDRLQRVVDHIRGWLFFEKAK